MNRKTASQHGGPAAAAGSGKLLPAISEAFASLLQAANSVFLQRLESTDLSLFLRSFLAKRGRVSSRSEPTTSDDEPSLQILGRHVLLVICRLAVQAPSAPSLQKTGLFTAASLLDLCALYTAANAAVVGRLVDAVLRTLGDAVVTDMERTVPSILDFIRDASGKISTGQRGSGSGVRPSEFEALLSLEDAVGAVAALLGCSFAASTHFGPLFQPPSMDATDEAGLAAVLSEVLWAVAPMRRSPKSAQQLNADAKAAAARARHTCRSIERAATFCLHSLLLGVFGMPAASEDGARAGDGRALFRSEEFFSFIVGLAEDGGEGSGGSGGCSPLLEQYCRRYDLWGRLAALGEEEILENAQVVYLLELLPDSSQTRKGRRAGRRRKRAGRSAATAATGADVGRSAGAVSPPPLGGAEQARAAPLIEKELDAKIKEVQAVLGGPGAENGLGDGFVGACLAGMGFSVEAVVGAILEDSLPPHLARLDRGLQKAWRGKRGDNDRGYAAADGEERAALKEQLRASEREAEKDAYILLREYGDDYDDTYDDYGGVVGPTGGGAADGVGGARVGSGVGGGAGSGIGGGGGGGLTDAASALRYNRLVRAEENEAAFWQANRNLNRRGMPAGGGSDNGEGGDGEEVDGGDSGSGGTAESRGTVPGYRGGPAPASSRDGGRGGDGRGGGGGRGGGSGGRGGSGRGGGGGHGRSGGSRGGGGRGGEAG
ncbi:unnamed protein product, partial [Phaeothamnion confervicola]